NDLIQPPDDVTVGATAPFTLAPHQVRGLVKLDVPLVQKLVGLFLGESTDTEDDEEGPQRRLTRLDMQMARWICQDIVDAMLAACKMPDVPRAEVGTVHTNPRSVRSLPQSPSVIEVEIELGPSRSPFGRAAVVLPAQANGVLWPERRQAQVQRTVRSKGGVERVKSVPMSVVASIDRRKVPMQDLRTLKVGDVIEFGSVRNVTLHAKGRPILVGEAGEQDGHRCIRVVSRIGKPGAPQGDSTPNR
ncbi:MAG: FliM/FliN family flagellar motor switch protein, partial [Myxococcota bacterium]